MIGVDRNVHRLAALFLEDMSADWPEDFVEELWDKALDEFAQEVQAAIEDLVIEFEQAMTLHLALRSVGLAE